MLGKNDLRRKTSRSKRVFDHNLNSSCTQIRQQSKQKTTDLHTNKNIFMSLLLRFYQSSYNNRTQEGGNGINKPKYTKES